LFARMLSSSSSSSSYNLPCLSILRFDGSSDRNRESNRNGLGRLLLPLLLLLLEFRNDLRTMYGFRWGVEVSVFAVNRLSSERNDMSVSGVPVDTDPFLVFDLPFLFARRLLLILLLVCVLLPRFFAVALSVKSLLLLLQRRRLGLPVSQCSSPTVLRVCICFWNGTQHAF
jgi:hypothetical protein